MFTENILVGEIFQAISSLASMPVKYNGPIICCSEFSVRERWREMKREREREEREGEKR